MAGRLNDLVFDQCGPVLIHPASTTPGSGFDCTDCGCGWRVTSHGIQELEFRRLQPVQRGCAYGIIESDLRVRNAGRNVACGDSRRVAATRCTM